AGTPTPTPGTPTPTPRRENVMRVQLQRDSERLESTIAITAAPATGVTTKQVRDALARLHENAKNQTANYKWFPYSSLGSWLRSAIISISDDLKRFPPGGITEQNLTILRKDIPFRGKRYRVDVENMSGHNLRQ
ncbi:MAG: hypothetical protein MI924_20495, partial [Chloroflexales bacterium]|nr:hypothetical protein [Chloroflexales bacterium]